MDWLGKMINLPEDFLSCGQGSKGGGVIQSAASECVLDCLLAARAQAIRTLKAKYGDEFEETTLLSKLMAYCSKEAHSCVEKAAMIGFVKLRILEPDQNCSLRGLSLRRAMEEDIQNGLYPFFVSTTLGTTGCCAFDNLQEIGNSRIFSIFWLSLLIISTVFHKVLAVIVTRDKNTRSGFLHFRMCLIPGENLAPILGRSPGAPQ